MPVPSPHEAPTYRTDWAVLLLLPRCALPCSDREERHLAAGHAAVPRHAGDHAPGPARAGCHAALHDRAGTTPMVSCACTPGCCRCFSMHAASASPAPPPHTQAPGPLLAPCPWPRLACILHLHLSHSLTQLPPVCCVPFHVTNPPRRAVQFGNPHSRTHLYGWESEEAVETARAQVSPPCCQAGARCTRLKA